MIRILILEDQEINRIALRELIISAGTKEEIVVHSASTFEEGRSYVEGDTTYDAFFLDINLSGSDSADESGLELARLIRGQSKYEFTPVIMVTSIAKLEMAAYRELHCYQYLIKPYVEADVESIVKKLLGLSKVKEESSILVKKDGINYRIKCNAIVYIQAVPRGVCLYLKKESMRVPYLTIVKLMEQLPQEDFIQCHRMFVVNRRHIDNVDFVNRMIKVAGYDEPVELGGTYRHKVRDALGL